jgi:membrane associated rhomboid family serine protease
VLPQHVSRLPEIFTAPFLHFSWQHIEGNTVPLFVLGALAAYRGIKKFLLATLIIAVVSGLAVWLFQSGNELTVGASGLIFGYFGYVLTRGFFDRNLVDIGVGVVAGLLYWTILQVAIPGNPGISWIGHLGGLLGGVLAAWVLRTRVPPSVPRGGWTTGLGRHTPQPSAPADGASSGHAPAARPGSPGSQAADDLLRELEEKGF